MPSNISLAQVRRLLAANQGVQLNRYEIHAIARIIRAFGDGCRLLVFGVGNDSPLWMELNQKGETTFLEDDEQWYQKFKTRFPNANIRKTKYTTEIADWKSLLDQPERLCLDLDPTIRDAVWNVVIVDGPRGNTMAAGIPGRMQSIFTASQFMELGAFVFVHDAQREVETAYCDRFLGRHNLVLEFHSGGYQDLDTLQGYCKQDSAKAFSQAVRELGSLRFYTNIIRSPVMRLKHLIKRAIKK